MKERRPFVFPREVLLVEIERHCFDPRCGARVRIGLTKEDARAYRGFECGRCERWHEDVLTERDVPDWWEELTVTGLDALRGRKPQGDESGTNESVARLSEAWRELRAAGGGEAEDEQG